MIKLDIFSDPVCPWCYLGKANLDRALEQHPDHPFAVEWHPFQLNPDMPAEGVDKRSYLLQRFGVRTAVAGHPPPFPRHRQTKRRADGPRHPQTHPQHPERPPRHPLGWARRAANLAVSALMRAYWVEGRDIGNLVCWPTSRPVSAWTAASWNACLPPTPTSTPSRPAKPTPASAAFLPYPPSSSPTNMSCPARNRPKCGARPLPK